jgi:hypothetical protein
MLSLLFPVALRHPSGWWEVPEDAPSLGPAAYPDELLLPQVQPEPPQDPTLLIPPIPETPLRESEELAYQVARPDVPGQQQGRVWQGRGRGTNMRNMTTEVQLAAAIADAKVAAADQAWLRARESAKKRADVNSARRAQAELAARAVAKAEADANEAAEAEAESEARAAEKDTEDIKTAAVAIDEANARADANMKSDVMALAAAGAVRETRARAKTSDDAMASAFAVNLTQSKAISTIVSDARYQRDFVSQRERRVDRGHLDQATESVMGVLNDDAALTSLTQRAGPQLPAEEEFSCISIVPTATSYWCFITCKDNLALCPPKICRCTGGSIQPEPEAFAAAHMSDHIPSVKPTGRMHSHSQYADEDMGLEDDGETFELRSNAFRPEPIVAPADRAPVIHLNHAPSIHNKPPADEKESRGGKGTNPQRAARRAMSKQRRIPSTATALAQTAPPLQQQQEQHRRGQHGDHHPLGQVALPAYPQVPGFRRDDEEEQQQQQ